MTPEQESHIELIKLTDKMFVENTKSFLVENYAPDEYYRNCEHLYEVMKNLSQSAHRAEATLRCIITWANNAGSIDNADCHTLKELCNHGLTPEEPTREDSHT